MDFIINYFTNLTFNESNITIAAVFAIVILFECKFKSPIVLALGTPKLFEGTKKQRILAWIVFIIVVTNFFR